MGAYRFNRAHAIADAFRQLLPGDGDAHTVGSILYRRFAATAVGCWRELPRPVRDSLRERYPARVKELSLTDEEGGR